MKDRVGQGDSRLVSRNVGEGKLTVHIAAGVDMGDVRFKAMVGGDAARGKGNPGLIEGQVSDIRLPASGQKQGIPFDHRGRTLFGRGADRQQDGRAFRFHLQRLGPRDGFSPPLLQSGP